MNRFPARRTLSLVLVLTLCLGLFALPAAATVPDGSEAQAEALKSLGLFLGTGEGFQLDAAANRLMGVILLIRLTGQEEEALSQSWTHPFTDVATPWAAANQYIGYAYQTGLTTGGGDGTVYLPDTRIDLQQYLVFVLRAMGYSEADGDFTWEDPFSLARELGILPAAADRGEFLRADVVLVSWAALTALCRDGRTLAGTLMDEGVFTQEAFDAAQAQALKETGWQAARSYTVSSIDALKARYLEAVQAATTTITFTVPVGQEAAYGEAIDAFMEEDWALCPYYNAWSRSIVPGGGKLVVEPDYLYSWQVITFLRYADYPLADEAAALEEDLEAFVASAVTAEMTDREKVLAVHDALCLLVTYDQAGSEASADLDGVFGAHKAVCGGYAHTFEAAMALLGIPCISVLGKAVGRGDTFHAWNKVQLDGIWYNLDVTWDDYDDAYGISFSHAYFLLDDDAFAATHIWNSLYVPAS
ncbi:MAG TPA: transglutaminase domain-containing protein [Oscillospiraceae bacterium]|nr:transglutaminase domain-containing protein [Oscillospiraceae bacterium]